MRPVHERKFVNKPSHPHCDLVRAANGADVALQRLKIQGDRSVGISLADIQPFVLHVNSTYDARIFRLPKAEWVGQQRILGDHYMHLNRVPSTVCCGSQLCTA